MGPTKFTLLEREDQQFLFLHDIHIDMDDCATDNITCMPCVDFIERLIATSPYFIDVFLENSYGELHNPGMTILINRCQLNKTVQALSPYLQQQDCPFHNVRVHYGDVRYEIAPEFGFVCDYFIMVLHKDISIIDQIQGKITDGELKDRVHRLLQAPDKLNYFIDTYGKAPLFEKERVKSAYPTLANKILPIIAAQPHRTTPSLTVDQFLAAFNAYKLMQRKVLSTITFDDWDRETIAEETMMDVTMDIFFMCSWLLDYYILLRLLKKFNDPQHHHPDTVRNAIIYAGENHCEMMVSTLKELGYRVIAEHPESSQENNCLDISSLPWPPFER